MLNPYCYVALLHDLINRYDLIAPKYSYENLKQGENIPFFSFSIQYGNEKFLTTASSKPRIEQMLCKTLHTLLLEKLTFNKDTKFRNFEPLNVLLNFCTHCNITKPAYTFLQINDNIETPIFIIILKVLNLKKSVTATDAIMGQISVSSKMIQEINLRTRRFFLLKTLRQTLTPTPSVNPFSFPNSQTPPLKSISPQPSTSGRKRKNSEKLTECTKCNNCGYNTK